MTYSREKDPRHRDAVLTEYLREGKVTINWYCTPPPDGAWYMITKGSAKPLPEARWWGAGGLRRIEAWCHVADARLPAGMNAISRATENVALPSSTWNHTAWSRKAPLDRSLWFTTS